MSDDDDRMLPHPGEWTRKRAWRMIMAHLYLLTNIAVPLWLVNTPVPDNGFLVAHACNMLTSLVALVLVDAPYISCIQNREIPDGWPLLTIVSWGVALVGYSLGLAFNGLQWDNRHVHNIYALVWIGSQLVLPATWILRSCIRGLVKAFACPRSGDESEVV